MNHHPVRIFPSIVSTQAEDGGETTPTVRQTFVASLFHGDCNVVMSGFRAHYPEGFCDLIYADPPYRLSNGGGTCKNGRWASVDKAPWDRSEGFRADHAWNRRWLEEAQLVLKPDGTIWVSASHHNLGSILFAMNEIGMKVLSVVVWEKPDPPKVLSARFFCFGHEFVVWAVRNRDSRHTFNPDEATRLIGRRGQTVWRIFPPGPEEKRQGRHPTQKPVALLRRILLTTTFPDDLVFDPFIGSGTTAVACVETGRRCIGSDTDPGYLVTAEKRVAEALTRRDARARKAA